MSGEAEDEIDLYEVTTWEPRTVFDKLSYYLYNTGTSGGKFLVFGVAGLIFLLEMGIMVLAWTANPLVAVYVFFSVLPAMFIALYIWEIERCTEPEPVSTVILTFFLGMVFAAFPVLINTLLQPVFSMFSYGMLFFFFFVVAPVEETAKLLAVRSYVYQTGTFEKVIDGAVYGAFAGLGFATIENSLYLAGEFVGVGSSVNASALRSLAGPAHVIYTGIAGYYLGLAKFNSENRGPIILKGLLIAVLLHGTYNAILNFSPGVLMSLSANPLSAEMTQKVSVLVFILPFYAITGYYFVSKLWHYNSVQEERETC
ncbi:MAG: PrsW family intramembrane metalloprotease [Halobacteria archaeon]|nr:PrsW family intramembrane metalloprotease [Halobacteria archaeon]